MHRIGLVLEGGQGFVAGGGVVQIFRLILTATLGVMLGLASTFFMVERGFGFGAVRAGPWTGWPETGSKDADPYARAVLSRSGELPLGSAEGLSFLARETSAGAAFDPHCDYIVRGPVPQARYWTLTAATPEGRLIANTARRYGFTSAEVLRGADGNFEITAARDVRPGNWLPVAANRPFVLLLRLYDTSISATTSQISAASMPSIVKGFCG